MNNMKIIIALLMFQVFVSCAQDKHENDQEVNTTEKVNDDEGAKTIAEKLNPLNFKKKMEEMKGIIIDVRTTAEVNKGIIPGAKVIDYFSDQFKEKLLSFEKSTPIFVYCQSGGRSAEAFDLLVENGFQKVYELEGGMEYWNDDELPTEIPNNQ